MCAEKLLLLGGTFDPPHNGHMSLLRSALAAVQPDRVVVMPTGIPPHKEGGHTPGALRMEMCACFATLFPALTVSDLELRRAGKSYTIDTVQTLLQTHANTRVFLPMGSDMLLYFRKWRSWQELARLTTLVVLCRSAQDEAAVASYAQSLRDDGAQVLLAQGTLCEVSSTEIRAKAARGEDISALVPPDVAQIIAAHRLYCTQTGDIGETI